MSFKFSILLWLVVVSLVLANPLFAQVPETKTYSIYNKQLSDSIFVTAMTTAQNAMKVSFSKQQNHWLKEAIVFDGEVLWANAPTDITANLRRGKLYVKFTFWGNSPLGYIFIFNLAKGGHKLVNVAEFETLKNDSSQWCFYQLKSSKKASQARTITLFKRHPRCTIVELFK